MLKKLSGYFLMLMKIKQGPTQKNSTQKTCIANCFIFKQKKTTFAAQKHTYQ